ncbi:hypothetical protein ACFU8Q_18165 [Streptomyces sp. NPDC057543]|uniref:hypothetical protein n=1 Tax=Streptomyces sp. NPDC057543 TaxID=3346163 RepID=UPI003689C2E9
MAEHRVRKCVARRRVLGAVSIQSATRATLQGRRVRGGGDHGGSARRTLRYELAARVDAQRPGRRQEQDALGRINVKLEATRLADESPQAIRGAGDEARTDAITRTRDGR